MIVMYAIANCDTVKKARAFLEKNKIDYLFSDFKKITPTVEQIERWTSFFQELPVNKKGLTYKKVKDQYEELTLLEKKTFIIENTSMIKRPILEKNNKTLAIGFDEEVYLRLKL